MSFTLSKPPEESILEALFSKQMKKRHKMKSYWDAYSLAKVGDRTHTYDYLDQSAKNIIDRGRKLRARSRSMGMVITTMPSLETTRILTPAKERGAGVLRIGCHLRHPVLLLSTRPLPSWQWLQLFSRQHQLQNKGQEAWI